jgi:hypothetical protein
MFIPACWWVHIDSLQKLWDNAFQLNQFMWVHPKKNIEHSPWRYLSFLQPEWPQLRHAWRHVGNPSWTGEDKWPERASMFPWKGGTLERWDWTDIIYIIRYIYIYINNRIFYIYIHQQWDIIYIHQQWDIIYISHCWHMGDWTKTDEGDLFHSLDLKMLIMSRNVPWMIRPWLNHDKFSLFGGVGTPENAQISVIFGSKRRPIFWGY